MRDIAIEYLVKKTRVSRNGVRRVYYAWEPRKSDRVQYGVKRTPLATHLPSTAPEDEILAVAISEAQHLNSNLKRLKQDLKANPPNLAPQECVGTLPWLIEEYKKQPEYTGRSKKTQKNSYLYAFRIIEAWSAAKSHPPVSKLSRPAVWKFREALYRETNPKTGKIMIRRAELVMAALRLVLKLGYNRGLIPTNYAEDMDMIGSDARTMIWEDEQIEEFCRTAIEHGRWSLALAVRMAADLGQRQIDIRLMRWWQYNDETFNVRQHKTDARVNVPHLQELRDMIATLKRPADEDTLIILIDGTDQGYSESYFSHEFRRIADLAQLPKELQFRDLRRTAVVHLALAGCDAILIGAVTGHTLDETYEILETYCPRNSEMARMAIEKLARYRANRQRKRKKSGG